MKRKEIIREIIKSCSDCPYCKYDPHYNGSKDSGYNCSLAKRRRIDDQELDKIDKVRGIPIPDWCPLCPFSDSEPKDEGIEDS